MQNFPLHRLRFIILSLALAAFALPSAAAGKPNIIVIFTDDQGYADVSGDVHEKKRFQGPSGCCTEPGRKAYVLV